MATNYNSTHTGAQIDGFDARISALETALSTLQTNFASVSAQTTTNTNNISSIQTNYATKAQVNSLSMAPITNGTETTLTLTNSAKKTAWTVAIADWVAPSNGWLFAYADQASGTPALNIIGGGYQSRLSGNNTREMCVMLPVRAGQTYTINYIYCAISWAKFFPSATI